MRYKCQICRYTTDLKSQIHEHHIIPREAGGPDFKWNKVWLCPNCHSKIFSEQSITGIHAKKGVLSIRLIGWRDTTAGKLLEYIDENGETKYV